MFSRVSWSTQVALPWQGRWVHPVSPALSRDLPPLQGPFLTARSVAALPPLLGVPACVWCVQTHTRVLFIGLPCGCTKSPHAGRLKTTGVPSLSSGASGQKPGRAALCSLLGLQVALGW